MLSILHEGLLFNSKSAHICGCFNLRLILEELKQMYMYITMVHIYSWVKVFRIIPEFRILRLTFHRKLHLCSIESQLWELIIDSLINFLIS